MMSTRPLTATFVAMVALGNAACSTLELDDYCRYSETYSIRTADPESLALVLGVQAGRARQTPFVVVRSLSESTRGASVRLHTTPAPHPMPPGLDESRCAGVDWRTYTLTVDPDEWHAFWQDERNSPFEIGIAFLEDFSPLPLSAFGAAILDTGSADYLVSCGCFWR